MFNNLYTCCTRLQQLQPPVDGCSMQPKCVGAIKPIVKLLGNKLVCIRQLHRKYSEFNDFPYCLVIICAWYLGLEIWGYLTNSKRKYKVTHVSSVIVFIVNYEPDLLLKITNTNI